MSNVRSRQTKNASCRCRSELRLGTGFRRCQNRHQQEAAPLSRQSGLSPLRFARRITWATRPLAVGSLPVQRAPSFKSRPSSSAERRCQQPALRRPKHRLYRPAALLVKPQGLCALHHAGTLLPMHLLYGSTSIEPGAPAPNHSIERTCLKPLRAFSPTAHVER